MVVIYTMDRNRSEDTEGGGLGPELESLLAKVPPPKAPGWFVAKTVARLRKEEDWTPAKTFSRLGWRWIWAAGAAALMAGWILWERPKSSFEISDAEVFAALDALVQQDEENRWWAGL